MALVIEAGDCTQSGTNVTDQTFAMTLPAYSIGDLIILNVGCWQDNNDDQSMSFPAGPDGETMTVIDNDYGPGVLNLDLEVFGLAWYIATDNYAGGTIIITSADAIARWDATAIRVLDGEFDPDTPISANSSQDWSSSNVTDLDMPAFSAAADDADGKLIVVGISDQDPWSNTPPSGYTEFIEHDQGRVAIGVWGRDAAVTSSESIAAATFDLAGAAADALVVYGYIVRTAPSGPADQEVNLFDSVSITDVPDVKPDRLIALNKNITGVKIY